MLMYPMLSSCICRNIDTTLIVSIGCIFPRINKLAARICSEQAIKVDINITKKGEYKLVCISFNLSDYVR